MDKRDELFLGNEAITEGAIYAGAKFYAGYPITPSSEIMNTCSKRLPEEGGVFIQMEDEIGSIAAVIGASLAGAKGFTATSGPGFSLMQENLGVAVLGEVPCVVVDVQRTGPSTGIATRPGQADIMQMRWGRHGDQSVIALSPGSVAECFEVTVAAFNMAEKYRVPVIIAADEVVAHTRQNYRIPAQGEIPVINRKQPTVPPEEYLPFEPDEDGIPPIAPFGSEYVFHVNSTMHGPNGYANITPENTAWRIKQLHSKIEKYYDEIVITKEYDTQDDIDVLLIAYGATTGASRVAALEARERGIRVGVLQLITIWPFAYNEIQAFTKRVKKIVVSEMNYVGQVAGEIEKILPQGLDLVRVNKYNGQIITPQEILAGIIEEAPAGS